ncbi:MAG: hypothetical protein K2R98_04745 [Gemmataceae bacterium]|nr:hypothetical protein [Gemmataceae bacterium]
MPPPDEISHQLPSTIVAKEFGEVNVRRAGQVLHVGFTVLMEPQGADAEGWQTGVALDASSSMKGCYGRRVTGDVPTEAAAEYARRGWVQVKIKDGARVQVLQKPAHEDALRRGYVRYSDNIIEPRAREFVAYLAGNLDADGGTTVIYWACGDGTGLEVLGDVTVEQCRSLEIRGPAKIEFGAGTQLTPAVDYFVQRFRDAPRGMFLFLTDGRLDDLARVKQYTTQLAEAIAAHRRNPVKCVLIGVGDRIDEQQMEELDDLDTGTGVDIWDHKIARDMRGLTEIFAEVVDENQIIAPTARIFDATGRLVKHFTDGLSAKVAFEMPAASAWFELEVGGQRVRQSVAIPR